MNLLAPFRKPRLRPHSAVPLALPARRSNDSTFSLFVVPRVRDEQTGEILTLDRVAARYPRAVLLSEPGAGKTSALNFLSEGTQVLSLSDYHPLAPPQRFENPRRIFLDDVSPSTVHAEYLARLAADKPAAQIIAAAEDGSHLPADFARLALMPFHEHEAACAVRPWLRPEEASALLAAAKAQAPTRRLLYHPLSLFMLIQLWSPGERLPARRAELFDRWLTAYLRAEPDPDFARRALEGIALSVKRGQLAKDEHLARGYGLLKLEPSGRVGFVHSLLHDFLTARALHRSPDPAPLLERLADEKWKQVVLFYAGLADAEHLAQVVNALAEDGRWELAAQALGAAPQAGDDLSRKVARPLIERAWEGEDLAALVALAALGSADANEFFAARLKARDWQERLRAVRALGALKNDRAVEALLPLLRDPNAEVRPAVVAALGASQTERVVEPLLVALRGDQRGGIADTALRAAAAQALGRTGSEKAVPALIVEVQVGEPGVRDAAARALVEIRSELSRRPLLALADSSAPDDVRAAAQQILNGLD